VARSTNRELFASNNPDMLAVLERNAALCEDGALRGMLGRITEGLRAYGPGPYLMTDDRAPVELLGMQVIDDLIRDEVAYYKGIYQRDGIQGVINGL